MKALKSYPPNTIGYILLLLLTTVLVACDGNGGSNGSGDDTSSLELRFSPDAAKTLRFSWDPVDGATEYRLLEDPDGMTGYSEVASVGANTHEYTLGEVFLPEKVNARYILQVCDSSGCTDSDALYLEEEIREAIGYVKASNAETNDFFGMRLAISRDGSTLVVGADGEDSANVDNPADNSLENSGAVYVYTHTSDGWVEQAYIKPSLPSADDQFGYSVALSANGDTLAVGAVGEASSAVGIGGDQTDQAKPFSGAVYVFTRTGGDWSEQAYLKASNPDENDLFGSSVALSDSGDVLAVGAYLESSSATGINGDQTNNDLTYAGAAYVFTRSEANWSQEAYVKASNTDSTDHFGYSVSLSGDGATLAVGARAEDSSATGVNGNGADNNAIGSGAVYVFFKPEGGNWGQEAYIKASNTETGDWFGRSVDLSKSGDILAVGADKEDSSATGVNGNQSSNDAIDSGAVYLFTRAGTSWSQEAYLKASNTDSEDRFGKSLSFAGDGATLAVGARHEQSSATGINGDETDNSADGSGAVYLFGRESGNWSQEAYIKAPETGAHNESFGNSIGISEDGQTLAVGARNEDGSAKGIGGDHTEEATNSGAVFLY